MTVVTAPAGWGKTVLLSAWARAGVAAPTAWLSIESGDDGPRFWTYLHAGLRDVLATADADPVPVPGSLPHGLFLEILTNALSRLPKPVVLILDNVHEIGPETLDDLEFLLSHAPERARLVLSGRTDPTRVLHRWRLNGNLTELRMSDLAFTTTEVDELIQRHGTILSGHQVDHLWHRTEGWPAALCLAARQVRARPVTVEAIDEVRGQEPAISDYLVNEVLIRQPPEIQETLLRSSVPDRLCGGLVDALTGRDHGEQTLADLERADAFMVTGEAQPTTYRFLGLFRDVLRGELHRRGPQTVTHLHRRSAGWFAANHMPREALGHALCGGDPQHAVEMLVRHWPELATTGHDTMSTLRIPAAVDDDSPEIALAHAALALDRRHTAAAAEQLDLAERRTRSLPAERRDRAGLIAAALGLAQRQIEHDPTRARAQARQMLTQARVLGRSAGPDAADAASSIALTALGAGALDLSDLKAAGELLCDALAAAERAGLSCQRLICTSRLAMVHAERGHLATAQRLAETACDMAPCAGQPLTVHRAYAYLALALVSLHRDRLDDAMAHLDVASGAMAADPEPATAAMIAAVRIRVCQERGNLDAAYQALLAGRQALDGWPRPAELAARLAVAEADLRTAHGEAGDVRQWLEPLVRGPDRTSAAMSVAAARACLRDGDPRATLDILAGWEIDPAGQQPAPVRLDAGLVLALASQRVGDRRRAAETLEDVLRTAEPDGYRRIFTGAGQDVRDLLVDHLDSGTAHWATVNSLTEAMSGRSVGTKVEPAGHLRAADRA